MWKDFDVGRPFSRADKLFIERLSIQVLEDGYYIDLAYSHFQAWYNAHSKSLDTAWNFSNLNLSIIHSNPDEYSESIKFRSLALNGIISFLKEDFEQAILLLHQAMAFKGCSADQSNIRFVLYKISCLSGNIALGEDETANRKSRNAIKLLSAQVALSSGNYKEARKLLASFTKNRDIPDRPAWYFLNLWLEFSIQDFDALPYRYEAYRKYVKRNNQSHHFAFRFAKIMSRNNWSIESFDSTLLQAYREQVLFDLKGADLIPYLIIKPLD